MGKTVKLVFVILLSLSATEAFAGCETDNDCKGDRICESGRCVNADTDTDNDAPKSSPRSHYSQPSPNATATVCLTNFGTCPMMVLVPQGSSCFCRTPSGPLPGIAQ